MRLIVHSSSEYKFGISNVCLRYTYPSDESFFGMMHEHLSLQTLLFLIVEVSADCSYSIRLFVNNEAATLVVYRHLVRSTFSTFKRVDALTNTSHYSSTNIFCCWIPYKLDMSFT